MPTRALLVNISGTSGTLIFPPSGGLLTLPGAIEALEGVTAGDASADGYLVVYRSNGFATTITAPALTADRDVTLPDRSGEIVVYSSRPAFRAAMASNQVVSTGTWTKLQFGSEDFDLTSSYDPTTNYRFTAPIAGVYYFTVRVSSPGNTGANTSIGLRVNGSEVRRLVYQVAPSASPHTTGATSLVNLAASDYVEAWVYQDSGGNKTFDGTAAFTEFSGYIAR